MRQLLCVIFFPPRWWRVGGVPSPALKADCSDRLASSKQASPCPRVCVDPRPPRRGMLEKQARAGCATVTIDSRTGYAYYDYCSRGVRVKLSRRLVDRVAVLPQGHHREWLFDLHTDVLDTQQHVRDDHACGHTAGAHRRPQHEGQRRRPDGLREYIIVLAADIRPLSSLPYPTGCSYVGLAR